MARSIPPNATPVVDAASPDGAMAKYWYDFLQDQARQLALPNLSNYANDAAAAAAGVAVGGLYRNGSVIQIRVS